MVHPISYPQARLFEVQVVLEQAHIWASPIAINLLVGDAQHVYVPTPVESQ